ncbi:MAG TPA: cytidine deaminase [Bacteroidetes bacterium]|nr:cytidine deaminase [Bacteroidota bacterium]HRR07633.1 cytidine deaminase [Rhodothermales bacterium]
MKSDQAAIMASLRRHLAPFVERAYAPYSQKKQAVILQLSDGSWVAGSRVENASYSLVIPAAINAFSTAVAMGRKDVVAMVASDPIEREDMLYLERAMGVSVSLICEDVLLLGTARQLLKPTEPLIPYYPVNIQRREDGLRSAGFAAQQALIPESYFPVGCVVLSKDGYMWPGCNVESSDWQRVICAERNALGTAITYGFKNWSVMYLSCPKDPSGTPCGACRQVMIEFAPDMELVMDRGLETPFVIKVRDLLPFSFTGDTLKSEGTSF